MNILISIIIPVYNVKKYLSECLNSVISQMTDEIEIILVNDGSTDGSDEICKEYENKYSYIKVIEQKNLGLSEARNTGINIASGMYLVFLDSDDYLNIEAISRIKQIIKNRNVDVILGKAAVYNEDSKTINVSTIDYGNNCSKNTPIELFAELNNNSHFWFAAWLLIVKKEFLIQNGLYFKKGLLHEDELWVPQVFLNADSFEVLNYDFYIYRTKRSGSIVNDYNIKREFDKFVIIDELTSYINETNLVKSNFIKSRIAALQFGVMVHSKYYRDNERYNELLGYIKENVKYLYYSKYKVIFILCKLFGVKVVLKLLLLMPNKNV